MTQYYKQYYHYYLLVHLLEFIIVVVFSEELKFKKITTDDYVVDIEDIWKEPFQNEGRVLLSDTDGTSIRAATLNKLIINLTSPAFQGHFFFHTHTTQFVILLYNMMRVMMMMMMMHLLLLL
jgi:hypothetical protein